MARTGTDFRCSACDIRSVKWTGRCAKCGAFGTVVEVPAQARRRLGGSAAGVVPGRAALPASRVAETGPVQRVATGIGEFDRVLSGGLVPGQVVLCSGPPGSGKSTLLLAVGDGLAKRARRPVLYISGEESVAQIGVRAQRIGADSENLLLADDTDLATVIGHIEQHGPSTALVIVDSVQTITSADVEGRAGGVAQVLEVAHALTRVAKTQGIPVVLIGQVTKDSSVAGPRALEHVVDATLTLDGEAHSSLRILRAAKNRFGSLETAAFEQTDTGMREVVDPSRLFRAERDDPVPGTCVTVTVEGHRALIAEVQALVAATQNPTPRRAVSGLDSARAAMLGAVTERAAHVRLSDKDLFLATVAGMRLSDPGSDLAVCLAIVSAAHGVALPMDVAAIGEVTLSGDLRPVPTVSERVAEAARLGYERVIVPPGTRKRVNGRAGAARLIETATLGQAIAVVGALAP